MKKFILLVIFLAVFLPNLGAETITLQTYYPAPFGAYDRIRLVPRAAVNTCNAATYGTMYVDTVTYELMLCKPGSANYASVGAWTVENDGDLLNTNTSGNVGIGITPTKKLDVNGEVRIRGTGGAPTPGMSLITDNQGNATWGWPTYAP